MVEKVFFTDEKIEKISERIEHLIKLGKNKSNSESRTSLSKSLSLKPGMFNNKVILVLPNTVFEVSFAQTVAFENYDQGGSSVAYHKSCLPGQFKLNNHRSLFDND